MKPAGISSTDKGGGLALLTFGNTRFHPTGDICSDTPRGPSWADAVEKGKNELTKFFPCVPVETGIS